MRVAFVYPNRAKRWPKFEWVREALARLGHDTRAVRTAKELREADAWAEVVLFEHKCPCMSPADLLTVAKHHRARWVQWWFDLVATDPGRPLEQQELVRAFAPVMGAMDVVLVKERGLLAEYAALGITAKWGDQACPAAMRPCEHRDTPEWDVLLWGCVRGYRQRKGDVRALLDADFRVAWAGHPSGVLPQGVEPLPWCEPLDLPALASRAAVVLGVSARNDIDGYWSDRFWLALGMGACLVHRATPGLPRHSPACYAVYRDEAELISVVAELRSDRITRQWAGDIARRWVMDNHTYEHRVCEVLNHDGT